jgi:predicted DCC family thiol-disulfide oxidoreductase YuxK
MGNDRIIVFDGVCVLCSRWVSFVLRHDRQGEFKLAAMQSSAGRALLANHGIDPDDPVTFLVLDGNAALTDTDALISVLARFGFVWRSTARLLGWVPRRLRDRFYRYVARNRYRLFGRRDVCLMPASEYSDRFIK